MAQQLITEDWCWRVYADAEQRSMEAHWRKQAKLAGEEFKAYLKEW